MSQPQGPGTPFHLLFDDRTPASPVLPPHFRAIYDGDWEIPTLADRPYTFSNFAQGRDGRISFNEPGASAGADVSGFNQHDRWLMGLLRARADAVMVGDVTANLETGHLWTAEHICDYDAPAFSALRVQEGRRRFPIHVIVSLDGNVRSDALCFTQEGIEIVIATTRRGAERLQNITCRATLVVYELGEDTVDLRRLVALLFSQHGVSTLLCEGGARLFAAMLDVGLIDEEFIALCPTFIGRSNEKFRPSYGEGVAWQPGQAPYSQPVSLRRAGDVLFMRTRCRYWEGGELAIRATL